MGGARDGGNPFPDCWERAECIRASAGNRSGCRCGEGAEVHPGGIQRRTGLCGGEVSRNGHQVRDDFVSKYPNSDLLVYTYPLYYRAYTQLRILKR